MISKRVLCPFCLTTSESKNLLYQCTAPVQRCAPVVNETLARVWNITAPRPTIFHAKKNLSSTPKCPHCGTTTATQCCPNCAHTLHSTLIEKKHTHITCFTNNKNNIALFYQSLYSAIERYLGQQKNLLLEGPLSTTSPFFLKLTIKGVPHSLVFHAVAWENITHPLISRLQNHTTINAAFLPCSPPAPITSALHMLRAHTKKDTPMAFVLQDSTSLLAHIPPDHLFFRHMPHHASYNAQAAQGLSFALQDMLVPLWGVHALEYINAHYNKHHFFIDTASFVTQSTAVPQGWKVDEFLLWVLASL